MRVPITIGLLCSFALTGAAQDEPKLEIPPPEALTLRTKDFVQLHATFYPGGFAKVGADEVEALDGKTVAPVILVHGWGEKRQDLSYLARGLQSLGYAVIVPDLRGHGRSTKRIDITGREYDLDYEKFRRGDIGIGFVEDIVACKRHLMKLNNDGKLNIEMLTVVASDVGALAALNWIAYDWSRPILPTQKQGHDVKAFVLLTPPMSFKGATVTQAMRHPVLTTELDGLIFVGARDTKAAGDVRRIFKQLASNRDDPPTDLFLKEPDTKLAGTKLITARGLGVASTIAKFINARIVRKQDEFPWRDRSGLLSD